MNFIKCLYRILFRKNFGNSTWKKHFAFFGENSTIVWPGFIQGYGNITIGDNVTILKNARIQIYNSLTDGNLIIGNNCYIGTNFSALVGANISIGNDVLIASYVLITSENHGMNPESGIPYSNQPLVCKPVSVGDGTWIGEKVCILPGVEIGKKCIIGAGSVVTRSIPDYSISAGNPAKVIKVYDFNSHSWISVSGDKK